VVTFELGGDELFFNTLIGEDARVDAVHSAGYLTPEF